VMKKDPASTFVFAVGALHFEDVPGIVSVNALLEAQGFTVTRITDASETLPSTSHCTAPGAMCPCCPACGGCKDTGVDRCVGECEDHVLGERGGVYHRRGGDGHGRA